MIPVMTPRAAPTLGGLGGKVKENESNRNKKATTAAGALDASTTFFLRKLRNLFS